jgi:hypothetical protein
MAGPAAGAGVAVMVRPARILADDWNLVTAAGVLK